MSDETFAGVASKTVDHIAGGVKAVADAAQKIAPRAWEIAVRQQRIEASVGIASAGFVTLVALVAIVYVARSYRDWVSVERAKRHAMDRRRYPAIAPAEPTGHEDALLVQAPAIAVVAVASLAIVCALVCASQDAVRLANPEYYAATALLEAVK